MRAAGEKLGLSDSYISQIENGRANPPKGDFLDRLLTLYGGITQKYFYDLARNWEKETTDKDFIEESLNKLSDDNLKLIRSLVTTMMSQPKA